MAAGDAVHHDAVEGRERAVGEERLAEGAVEPRLKCDIFGRQGVEGGSQ